MNAEERLLDAGFEDVVYFANPDYDDALIGVDTNNRAVYDYSKMVEWLIEKEDCTEEDAVDYIDYNTIRSLPYMGEHAPIVMYPLD